MQATGTFEVTMQPQGTGDTADGVSLGRSSIDKQFHGDLEGTSKGEMLGAMTSVPGSAGYVAIERVTGILGGWHGSFVLLHRGLMTRGTPEMSVTIVPDSGTDELIGLSGILTISFAGEKHAYDIEYSLAPTAS